MRCPLERVACAPTGTNNTDEECLVKQLSALIQDADKRKVIASECCDLIDAEVKTKGLIVKGAYKVVQAVKPGTIPHAVEGLLDEFVAEMQPFYEAFQSAGSAGTLQSYFGQRSSEIAEALLTVTDRRSARSSHRTLVKAYQKLRPKGKEHVSLAMPRVGALLDRHVGSL